LGERNVFSIKIHVIETKPLKISSQNFKPHNKPINKLNINPNHLSFLYLAQISSWLGLLSRLWEGVNIFKTNISTADLQCKLSSIIQQPHQQNEQNSIRKCIPLKLLEQRVLRSRVLGEMWANLTALPRGSVHKPSVCSSLDRKSSFSMRKQASHTIFSSFTKNYIVMYQ